MALGRNSKGQFSSHGKYTMSGHRKNPKPKKHRRR